MYTSSGSFRPLRRVSRPIAAVLLFTGCFHYVPAPPPLPGPQTEVRVTLRDPIDIPMGEFTLNDVNRIEGVVAEVRDDTLDVVARWLFPRFGRRYDALYGSYGIPVAGIEQVEKWRFSGKRTAVFVGVSAAVATIIAHAAWRVIRGDEPGDVVVPPASVMAPR